MYFVIMSNKQFWSWSLKLKLKLGFHNGFVSGQETRDPITYKDAILQVHV